MERNAVLGQRLLEGNHIYPCQVAGLPKTQAPGLKQA